jgi:hypothetical protein
VVHQATGDIEVQAFATRPNPFTRVLDGLRNQRSTIADLHFDFNPTAPATVSGMCPEEAASLPQASQRIWSRLRSKSLGAGDAAGGRALDVTYEVGGGTRTTVIPFGVWLCATTCPPEAKILYHP